MSLRLLFTLVSTLGLLAPIAALAADREEAAWFQMAVAENGGAPVGVSRTQVAATPEPGSALLLAAGGVVVALGLRRRR